MSTILPQRETMAAPDSDQVQRLTALGELAAGLAHEIQQRLTVIANYANGCYLRLEDNRISREELMTLMKEISSAAIQASEITRRARNFSKKQTPEMEIVDMLDLVSSSVGFVRETALQHKIRISNHSPQELPAALADPIQTSQVLNNLLLNAVDALAEHSGERRIVVDCQQRCEDFIQVTVSDSGPGIDPELQCLVFEPFYTTKSNGMGIGLGICQSIIELHGGHISLDTSPLGGARFVFTLPKAPALI